MTAEGSTRDLIACSHRRHGQDKTVLSCPRQWCEHNCIQDKTVLSLLDLFSNLQLLRIIEHLEIGNWVETRQNCLVLSTVVFTPPTRTRQDSLHVSGANKLLETFKNFQLTLVNSEIVYARVYVVELLERVQEVDCNMCQLPRECRE